MLFLSKTGSWVNLELRWWCLNNHEFNLTMACPTLDKDFLFYFKILRLFQTIPKALNTENKLSKYLQTNDINKISIPVWYLLRLLIEGDIGFNHTFQNDKNRPKYFHNTFKLLIIWTFSFTLCKMIQYSQIMLRSTDIAFQNIYSFLFSFQSLSEIKHEYQKILPKSTILLLWLIMEKSILLL